MGATHTVIFAGAGFKPLRLRRARRPVLSAASLREENTLHLQLLAPVLTSHFPPNSRKLKIQIFWRPSTMTHECSAVNVVIAGRRASKIEVSTVAHSTVPSTPLTCKKEC
jgi:hypothetical protein